ncbi:hypothetical protein [Actinomadura sp. NPDC000600]|uniref:hypothetical protein n=1 Tax=Actinomadura sp. NPDC000600 TaxID=3154262 RepID=UPI00339805AF
MPPVRSLLKKPPKPQKAPYLYALALTFATGALLALVLIFLDDSTTTRVKLAQIGTGLAASIMFAVIYTVLGNREYAELIRKEIATQLVDHHVTMLEQITQLNELFLPRSIYPPAAGFDQRFNRDLISDICSSREYIVRSTSAKYVPARIRHCDHNLEVVRVLMVDPRDRLAIEARAQDRRKRPEEAGRDLSSIKHQIKSEILSSVVALFDSREHCEVEVGVVAGTSALRIELVDDAIYTALYRSPESLRSMHPETVRYGKSSQLYEIFKDECRRQLRWAQPIKRFTSGDDDDVLLAYLAGIGFSALESADLARIREDYEKFIANYATEIKKIGR